MFKDIVLAVTPRRVCDTAVDKGVRFARKFNANLYLVHVCGLDQGWGGMEQIIPSGRLEQIKKQIEDYFRSKLSEDFELYVIPGSPHSEILRLARKKNADLIVMGTHDTDQSELRNKTWSMTGSCLEKVSQRSRCPVMIVNPECIEQEPEFSDIVVATDFSKGIDCAVSYAGQMARQYKANLHFFHVLQQGSDANQLKQKELQRYIQVAKEKMVSFYQDQLKGLDHISFDAWEGQPAVEILKYARYKQASLIVMAHHSKEKDPEEAYLGSTVANVALNSLCPTMSINRHFDLRCALY